MQRKGPDPVPEAYKNRQSRGKRAKQKKPTDELYRFSETLFDKIVQMIKTKM